MDEIDTPVFLIKGASTGIGPAAALGYVRQGDRIGVSGRRAKRWSQSCAAWRPKRSSSPRKCVLRTTCAASLIGR